MVRFLIPTSVAHWSVHELVGWGVVGAGFGSAEGGDDGGGAAPVEGAGEGTGVGGGAATTDSTSIGATSSRLENA